MRLFLVVVGLLLQATVHAQDSNSGGPPPFFIQDPSDGLCLAGEDFQKCSINTLFYVLGEPGTKRQIKMKRIECVTEQKLPVNQGTISYTTRRISKANFNP